MRVVLVWHPTSKAMAWTSSGGCLSVEGGFILYLQPPWAVGVFRG